MKQMGRDGLLGISWPKQYGGQERSRRRAVHLRRRGPGGRLSASLPDAEHRRADAARVRHRGAEPAISARASSPARSSSRSATPSPAPAPTSRRCTTTRRARRRRVGDQRPEDVDEPGRVRRLRLARGAHGSRRRPSTAGSRSSSCPPTAKGFSRQPIRTVGGVSTNATFYDDVRVPAENLIGGENNGWRLITGPAQPRADLADDGRAAAAHARRGHRLGAGDTGRRRARDRQGLGAAEPGAHPRQGAGAAAHELEAGLGRRRRASRTWPTRRRSRSTAASSSIEAYRALLEVLGAAGLLAKGQPGRGAAGRRSSRRIATA